MAGIVNSIINGFTNLGSQIGNGYRQLQDQSDANSARAAQAERDWQTEMSNSAISRQMKDLENAGVNKYAMFANGSPSGASVGSVGAASTTDRLNSAKSAASVLLSVSNLMSNVTFKGINSARGLTNDLGQLVGSIAKFLA